MRTVKQIIDDVIAIEGGYKNDPDDKGGETNYGITIKTARANGYMGALRDMPRQVAFDIYMKAYVNDPKFNQVFDIDPDIAAELVDTGVNMGQAKAAAFLQRALNVLEGYGLAEDGKLGPASLGALRTYYSKRGRSGLVVLSRMLNGQQCVRYMELVESNPSQRKYIFGWINNRVQ